MLNNIKKKKKIFRSEVALIDFLMKANLRSLSWWIRYFVRTSLEEDEVALKKFERPAWTNSYNPNWQIFHLRSDGSDYVTYFVTNS